MGPTALVCWNPWTAQSLLSEEVALWGHCLGQAEQGVWLHPPRGLSSGLTLPLSAARPEASAKQS